MPPQPIPAPDPLITALSLAPHPEGGYFVETDRSPHLVTAPWPPSPSSSSSAELRSASSSIFYLLTPSSPRGFFHRNKARTVHTHHRGRGSYIIIHSAEGPDNGRPDNGRPQDQKTQKMRVERFVVGPDVEAGERLQWVVGGGVWKGSFLLADEEGGGEDSGGLLISETVVPGFDYADHEFLTREGLGKMLGEEGVRELGWLVRGE